MFLFGHVFSLLFILVSFYRRGEIGESVCDHRIHQNSMQLAQAGMTGVMDKKNSRSSNCGSFSRS
jgi:hypothetical protein